MSRAHSHPSFAWKVREEGEKGANLPIANWSGEPRKEEKARMRGRRWGADVHGASAPPLFLPFSSREQQRFHVRVGETDDAQA